MPTAADPFGTVVDRAVYLPDAEAVVCADLHLGRAAASSVDVPLGEGRDVVGRLLALVDRFDPAEVVIAGDVLHAFGHVPREARTALGELDRGIEGRDAAVVLLSGNHDAQLTALVGEAPRESHELPDGTVVCHGHEPPPRRGSRYVVGHDHPAIVIEGRRRPCALYADGAYEGGDVLVLPAFNPGIPGTVVNEWAAGDALSPLLPDCTRFQPIVWDGEAGESLVFPPLGALRPYL